MEKNELKEILRKASEQLMGEPITYEIFRENTGISMHEINKHYDTWTDLCKSAGVEHGNSLNNLKHNYSKGKEYMIQLLKDVAKKLGTDTLSKSQFDNAKTGISAQTIASHFGGWSNALKATGELNPSPNYHAKLGIEILAKKFLNALEELKKIPTTQELERIGMLSMNTVYRKFGSYYQFQIKAAKYIKSKFKIQPDIESLIEGLIDSEMAESSIKEISKDTDAKNKKKVVTEITGAEKNNIDSIDAIIITATFDEFISATKIVNSNYPNDPVINDGIRYYKGTIKAVQKVFSVIIPYPDHQGIIEATRLTSMGIKQFDPRYVFMIGVCAGNKNICKIGDIIIAESSLNYQDVVEIERKDGTHEKKFRHKSCYIKSDLKHEIETFTRSIFIEEIQNVYPNKSKISNKLTAHFGLLVTGSTLQRSAQKMKEINNDYTGVKGLDMETFAVYDSANKAYKDSKPYFLSIKSVSDFGDNVEDKYLTIDERREYSLFTSSTALKYFINNYIN